MGNIIRQYDLPFYITIGFIWTLCFEISATYKEFKGEYDSMIMLDVIVVLVLFSPIIIPILIMCDVIKIFIWPLLVLARSVLPGVCY